MHGGRVEAHSDGPGKGSEFVVRLPLLAEACQPLARPAVRDAGAAGALRRPPASWSWTTRRPPPTCWPSCCETMGHEVRTAHDGAAALAGGAAERPDVVISDIGMPEHGRLRGGPPPAPGAGLEDAVLVALTGYGQESDRRGPTRPASTTTSSSR